MYNGVVINMNNCSWSAPIPALSQKKYHAILAGFSNLQANNSNHILIL